MVDKREKRFVNKMKEQPPKFGNTEGNQHQKIRRRINLDRRAGFWLQGLFGVFLSAYSFSLARKAAKKARANIEKVW